MENDPINKKIQSVIDLISATFKILPEKYYKYASHYLIPARTVDNPNEIFILNTTPDFKGEELPEYVTLNDYDNEKIYIRNYTPIKYFNNETDWRNVSKDDIVKVSDAINHLTPLIHQYNVSGITSSAINDNQGAVCVYVKYVGLLTLFDEPIPKYYNDIPVIVDCAAVLAPFVYPIPEY